MRRVIAVLAGAGLLIASLLTTIERRLPLRVPVAAVIAPTGSDHAAGIRARSIAPVPETPGRAPWRSAVASRPALNIYAHPDDPHPAYRVPTRNPWDQPIRFLVTRTRWEPRRRTWLRLLLGVEPNGSSGWVRSRDVHLAPDHDRIVVDMSTRVLRQFRDGRLVHRFQIAIGAPSTPTTPGLFFVWAKLPAAPSGPYGSYLLGLSGFSRVLTYWPGGGRMAIHGTDDPSDPGHLVSHGCVRVYNPQMQLLRGVPMGTPVRILPS